MLLRTSDIFKTGLSSKVSYVPLSAHMLAGGTAEVAVGIEVQLLERVSGLLWYSSQADPSTNVDNTIMSIFSGGQAGGYAPCTFVTN